MLNICTYFDEFYLNKGLALIESIKRNISNCNIFVLCFDDKVLNNISGVTKIKLIEIENYRKRVLEIKNKRLPKEYYATLTPVLPQFIFEKFNISCLFYVDADVAFWSNPEELETIFGDHSLLITPHENPITYIAGQFNVGVLGYKNDQYCLEFLKWWEDRCFEWCEWRAFEGKCADQKYLDILINEPKKFKNYLICSHPGVNLGPWNLAMHNIEKINNKLLIDGKNLICYHYHGFKQINNEYINDTGWLVIPQNFDYLYKTYNTLLKEVLI